MIRQYIVQFDSAKLPRIDTDFLVIGSGNSGLRAAIEANQHGDVLLITKNVMRESNTCYPQGRVPTVMSKDDTIASHVEDTLKAGEGLCDETVVGIMVEEGIQRVSEMIQWETNCDKEKKTLDFTQEVVDQQFCTIYQSDETGGATILANHFKKQEGVRVIEHAFAVDFMTQGDRCYGVVALIDDVLHCIFAKATILASGGLGYIYQCTSNPAVATGDGLAAAWRAGCEMMDMEFIQFHPTTLFLMEAPHVLISEVVRREGGILISSRGERFMAKYHGMEELAPCDVVNRAILNEMELTGSQCVYLDVTHLSPDLIKSRFSRIYQTCCHFGIDITTDVIPVRCGAHFMIGGICTNLNAETNLQGLYACGEVACTGVHGANWIASNPLLECIVFGARAGSAAVEYAHTIQVGSYANLRISSDDDAASPQTASRNIEIQAAKESIQNMMWHHAGLFRHGEGLEVISDELRKLNLNCYWNSTEAFEFQNMRDVAALITEAAILRTESRGTHYREDFPERNDVKWRRHIVFQQGQAAKIIA